MQRKLASRVRLKPILERDPSADLWRRVAIPASRDIRRLRPASLPPDKRFETLRDVAERKSELVEALQDLEPALAEAYYDCAPDAPCSIPGCPDCSREHRGYLYSETARINELSPAAPRYFVTVHLATIPAGKLTRVRIRDQQQKLQKRLERAGVHGRLVGGTEVELDSNDRALILHLHIVSIGVHAAAWDRLAAGRGNDRAIPIKREDWRMPSA
jgi:hypothetical protein